MKIARFFAALFAVAGVVLMVFTIGLCLFSLNAPVKIRERPQEAVSCAQELVDALNAGDLEGAAKKFYGQPDLGISAQPQEEMGALVWRAFLDSICVEFVGEFYVEDGALCRDISVSALDIPSVTANWQGGVHTFLTAKVQAAQDMAELYDENNDFRADLVETVIREAVEYSLQNQAVITTETITVTLISRERSWWVVPEDGLLRCLSGGLA